MSLIQFFPPIVTDSKDLPASHSAAGSGTASAAGAVPSNAAQLPNSLVAPPYPGMQRRGSVPCESTNNVALRSSFSIKRRSTKKAIRRRSSGGAEILSPILSEDAAGGGSNGAGSSSSSSNAWYRIKRDSGHRRAGDNESLLSRRRGSLPVEVLAIGYSGKCA